MMEMTPTTPGPGLALAMFGVASRFRVVSGPLSAQKCAPLEEMRS